MELEARIATVRMAETFVISRGASDAAEVVDVELRHEGVSGFGEAAPIERYDESPASALAFLEDAGELLGDDPFAFEAIEARLRERPGEQAAKAAIDAALHDLCGKLVGLPVWRLLGLRRGGPADLVDDLARRPRRHGPPRGEGARPVQASEAEARRRATGSTSSASAPCAVSPTCRCRST